MRRLSMAASGALANVACVMTRGWHLLRFTAEVEASIRNHYSDSEWTVVQASSFLYPWRVQSDAPTLTGEVKMFSLFRRRRSRAAESTMSGAKPVRSVPPRPAQLREVSAPGTMTYIDPSVVDPLSPSNPFGVYGLGVPPSMYEAPGASMPDVSGDDIGRVSDGQEYAPLDSTPSPEPAPSYDPPSDPTPSFDSGGSSYDSGSSPSSDSSPSYDSGGSSFDSGSSGGGGDF